MDKIVSYDELLEINDKDDVYLIEIREQPEIDETGLIPGSIHIAMSNVENELLNITPVEFKQKYSRTQPKLDSQIVFTCRSGRRAEIAMKNLEKLGYKNCKFYAGSWLEWASKTKKE